MRHYPTVSSGFHLAMFSTLENITLDFNLTYETNLTDGSDDDDVFRYPYTLAEGVVVAICLGIVIVMTIVGNVFVLLAVFLNSHLKSTTNYFIVNLAIADLLLGSIVLPFSAVNTVIDYWPFGSLFCNVWAATDVLCCTASIFSLCAISVDRYIGVTRPLKRSTILTEHRAVFVNVIIWAVSVVTSIPPFFGWKESPDPTKPWECEVNQQIGYVLFSVSVSFYMPLSVILILYFRIYRAAVKQTRFLASGTKESKVHKRIEFVTLRVHTGKPSDSHSRLKAECKNRTNAGNNMENKKPKLKKNIATKTSTFKHEKKAAKTLAIVVGVFILCWFPFFFILPLQALCDSCAIPTTLFSVLFWLGYCNSMMNPIIYACSHRELKLAFRRIVRCQCRRRPRRFADDIGVASPNNSSVSGARDSGQPSTFKGSNYHTGSFRGGNYHPKSPIQLSTDRRENSIELSSEPESPIKSLTHWQASHTPTNSVKCKQTESWNVDDSSQRGDMTTYKFSPHGVECATPPHSEDEEYVALERIEGNTDVLQSSVGNMEMVWLPSNGNIPCDFQDNGDNPSSVQENNDKTITVNEWKTLVTL